jgi:hypothetical protein
MQDILEELIRGVGYVALRVVTGGRYQSSPGSHLAEGAIGFALLCGSAWLAYACWPQPT